MYRTGAVRSNRGAGYTACMRARWTLAAFLPAGEEAPADEGKKGKTKKPKRDGRKSHRENEGGKASPAAPAAP